MALEKRCQAYHAQLLRDLNLDLAQSKLLCIGVVTHLRRIPGIEIISLFHVGDCSRLAF
jgi:hypothetical protein